MITKNKKEIDHDDIRIQKRRKIRRTVPGEATNKYKVISVVKVQQV